MKNKVSSSFCQPTALGCKKDTDLQGSDLLDSDSGVPWHQRITAGFP